MRAGFPTNRIPDFRNPQAFWFDVDTSLNNGIMRDGRNAILTIVQQDYPETPSRGRRERPPQNPTPTSPPEPSPDTPSASERLLSRTQIIVASISAAGLITVAVVTGVFLLLGGDDKKGDPKPTSSPSLLTLKRPEYSLYASGKKIAGGAVRWQSNGPIIVGVTLNDGRCSVKVKIVVKDHSGKVVGRDEHVGCGADKKPGYSSTFNESGIEQVGISLYDNEKLVAQTTCSRSGECWATGV